MRFPLMPFVADNIVAVEDSDPIHRIVLPPCAGVGDRLREKQHRPRRAGIIIPERTIPILRRFRWRERPLVASRQEQCAAAAFLDRVQFPYDPRQSAVRFVVVHVIGM